MKNLWKCIYEGYTEVLEQRKRFVLVYSFFIILLIKNPSHWSVIRILVNTGSYISMLIPSLSHSIVLSPTHYTLMRERARTHTDDSFSVLCFLASVIMEKWGKIVCSSRQSSPAISAQHTSSDTSSLVISPVAGLKQSVWSSTLCRSLHPTSKIICFIYSSLRLP